MYSDTYITLMIQSGYKLFCYFNISPQFDESTKSYKRKIKVYNADSMREVKTVELDPFADNWYIDMEVGGIKAIAELILVLDDGCEVRAATSNIVNTPNIS